MAIKRILIAFLSLFLWSHGAYAAFTTNKGYNNQTTGTNAGTWGIVLNQNFTAIDTNLGGTLTLSVAGNSNVTLSTAQAQNFIYDFTGTLTGNINVIFPAVGGFYVVNNQTSGAFTLTIQAGSSTSGVLVPQGNSAFISVDNSFNPPDVNGIINTTFTGTATSTGSANVQVVSSVTPAPYANSIGNILYFTAGFTNTGSATMAAGGASALTIKKDGSGALVNLSGGEIQAGGTYTLYCDGSNWVILNPSLLGALLSTNNLSDVANAATSLSNLGGAPLASPSFTGTPSLPTGTTAVTQSANNNSTKLATTAYVDTAQGLDLKIANNLSDLNSIGTALTNLGLTGGGTNPGYIEITAGGRSHPIFIQWGESGNINAGGGSAAISFSPAMPHDIFSILITQVGATSSAQAASYITSVSLSGFTIVNQAISGNVPFYWVAIGD